MALISVTISGNAAPLKKSLDESDTALGKFGSSVGKMGKLAAVGFAAAGAAAGAFAVSAIKGAEAARVADDRLAAVNKSMNLFGDSTAAVTTRLQKLADAQEFELGVTAETIKATQAKLLTFNELGKSANELGGQFDRATTAAVDLAAAGFGSAETNAIQLGKALQDPIKGITALAKSGVTFTDAEKERIAVLIESNKIGEAQELVLAAIEKQVGGTAAATVTSSFKIGAAFGHIKDSIGEVLLPIFDRLASFVVEKVIPFFNDLSERFGPRLADTFEMIGEFVTDKVVPAIRDYLIPFLQRLGEIITKYIVPIIRDVFIKSFEGMRDIFDIIVTKIRENGDNIQEYGNYLRDLGRFIVTYVAPVLIKTLGGAFTIVAKLIGPVLDIVFSLMGALGKLGQFLVKVAGFVVRTIGAMINPIIDGMNLAIRGANRLNPFSDIPEIPNLQLSSSIGSAPTAPSSAGTGPVVQDGLDRLSAASAGGGTFSVPSFAIPDSGGSSGGSSSGGGGGSAGGSRAGGSMFNDFSLGPIDSSYSGDLFSLDALAARSNVINITVNTVTTDGEFPNKVAEALQQYNLYNGPLDVQIAA
jgi:phage-related protein